MARRTFPFVVALAGCLASAVSVRAGEAPAVSPVRVAVCSFESRNEDPRLKKMDQRDYLASLVEERLKEVPYLQVLPRQKAGAIARDADFTLRGEYLTLISGRYRLGLRLVGPDGAAVASWSDETTSWRALVMDSREIEPGEGAEVGDRQAPEDRRSLVTALTTDVARELLRHYTLRQLAALHGSPDAIVASLRLDPKQDAYKSGEQVSLFVIPDSDCYVTALHLRAGGSIRLLAPARDQESMEARAKTEVPAGGQALAIRAILPAGEEESRVRIYLTREPLRLPAGLCNARTPDEQLRLAQALCEALRALPADSWADREMSVRIVPAAP